MSSPKSKAVSHKHCCRHLKQPKTPAAFAALPYPAATSTGSSRQNRLQNPATRKWKFLLVDESKAKEEAGWWFPIHPGTPLLDGSDDATSRGTVIGCSNIKPLVRGTGKNKHEVYGVCINAASLKALRPPNSKKSVRCALTFSVDITQHEEKKDGKPRTILASGWIPLSEAIQAIGAKDYKKVVGELSDFQCCARRYAKWGRHLTSPGKKLKFRSITDINDSYRAMAKGSVAEAKRYFEPAGAAAVATAYAHVDAWNKANPKKTQRTYYGALFINKNTGTGHFGDYLARTSDDKCGDGYTYVGANLSPPNSKNSGGGAPIPLDVFPAGMTFHCRNFKKGVHVSAPVFVSPSGGKTKNAKPVGRAIWCYGFVVVGSGKSAQYVYGWVPRMALT